MKPTHLAYLVTGLLTRKAAAAARTLAALPPRPGSLYSNLLRAGRRDCLFMFIRRGHVTVVLIHLHSRFSAATHFGPQLSKVELDSRVYASYVRPATFDIISNNLGCATEERRTQQYSALMFPCLWSWIGATPTPTEPN